MKEFLENDKGVHLAGVGHGGEFTLCGDSFDIAETEDDYEDGHLVLTKKRIVTCIGCIAEIQNCRNVKINSI